MALDGEQRVASRTRSTTFTAMNLLYSCSVHDIELVSELGPREGVIQRPQNVVGLHDTRHNFLSHTRHETIFLLQKLLTHSDPFLKKRFTLFDLKTYSLRLRGKEKSRSSAPTTYSS